MKKVAVVYSEYSPTIDAIISHLKDCEVVCFKDKAEGSFDLTAGVGVNVCGGLNVHHSLLPAFECEEPVKQAIIEGVKVTGITFYLDNPKRIIAQYPVFISNASHFDDVEREIQYLEQTLYPLVIEKLLNNELFEVKNLIKGHCGGCSGCSH